MSSDGAVEDLPRAYAATQRFTLGHPRGLRVSPDGRRVAFLRAASSMDPTTSLWVLDVATGEERVVADPTALGVDGAALTDEERVRRERVRESAGGVVSYATDDALRMAAFSIGGTLYTADLEAGSAGPGGAVHAVADPRPDPAGQRVAYVADGAVVVLDLTSVASTPVLVPESEHVTYGLAEFVAAEEMGRTRGFWWSPDGSALAVARVDVGGVDRWHLGDPAHPSRPPAELAYPAAGTPNADVSLVLLRLDGGGRRKVEWDRAAFPYLADVRWEEDEPLSLVLQSRDQRTLRHVVVDPETGATRTHLELHDQRWLDLVPGSPRWLPDGRLLHVRPEGDEHALAVDGEAITGGIQVRSIVGLLEGDAVVTASRRPESIEVWRIPLVGGEATLLSAEGGVASAAVGGSTLVVVQRSLPSTGPVTAVSGPLGSAELRTVADPPAIPLRVELLRLGGRELSAALVLPVGWSEADGPLPVLLDPYGGPHAQRVLEAGDAYVVSQWFAEAGFAVLVVDGRGTPGRGPAWERAVVGDLTIALDDQVAALEAAAALRPGLLDLGRVGIRGWSFGGYLAALAVLLRPDAVHAAVAGAPVTDWRLYDTHYTERYLGDPRSDDEPYRRSSITEVPEGTARPLLLIHGLADDNVVAAHTLRLSAALLAAGRLHSVLPLSGVTHMTPQVVVAEQLLRLQRDFLVTALGVTSA